MAWWSRKRRNDPAAAAGPVAKRVFAGVPVTPGMTTYEVTERLGPPLDVMDMAELIGGSSFAVLRSGPGTAIGGEAQLSDLPRTLFWIYLDAPRPGMEIDITFNQGRLASAKVRAHGLGPQLGGEHPWVPQLITDHVARIESEREDGLASRAAWHALTDPDVTDFVADHPKQPSGPGQFQASARRFGELDVLVSLLDVTSADEIRTRLPSGYLATLDGLLRLRGIRPGETDIAHWILGSDDDRTVAHLAFVAADRSVTAVLPWDLLTDEERRGGHETG